jgi:hypothetical protein
MSDESKLKVIFKDPQMSAKMVDILVNNKPQGWGRRSIAPYFTEKYGKIMKAVLDTMMEKKEDLVYGYDDFKQQFGLSASSLYLRINQSIKYVCEKMDTPDHKYSKFCEMFTIERRRGVGVILRFKPDMREGFNAEFIPKPIISKDELPKWKDDLNTWLEESVPGDEPFHADKLALNPEEIQEVKNSLVGLKGVISNVTSYHIKVIKLNDDAL